MASLNVPIRIKRGVGTPSTLKQGELAFDESGQRLFIGSGVGTGGNAASVVELTTPPTVLEDLANIAVGSGASDGDVLVYDSATGDWVAEAMSIAWDSVTSKPSFATVATTGAYSDLSGAPASLTPDAHKASHATGGTDALSPADIGAAASSHTHSASDITSGLAMVATSGAYSDLSGTPTLATVATTGAYSDLSGTPTLGTAAASATTDFAAASHTHSASDITSGLATVATTGAYSDLSGTPTLGTAAASATGDFAAASHSHAAADITSGTLDIARIPTGSTSSTVCIGDDARLSDNRDPNSHTHGNITNAGAIGSTSGLPVKTGTSGVLEAGAFGTSAGEFAEGDHTHAWTDITSKPSDFTPSAHNHTVTLEMCGLIESPEAKTYVISPAIPAAITITNVKAKTSEGTVDIKLQDDGVDITNTTIGDVGTSVAAPGTAPSASVAADSVLALVVSDLQTSPKNLAFTVHYTVASANNA